MGTNRIRERADRLREALLKDVLVAFGAERDPNDPAKWHTAKGTLSVTPPKFVNWRLGVGGGGAIDLVIHLGDLGFLAALDWLAGRFPELDRGRAMPPSPHPLAPTAALVLPGADASRLACVTRYLREERRLPPAQLDLLIEEGTLYADRRANAVFLMRDEHGRPIGAEIRGTTPQAWRGLARGSRKDLGCFAVPGPGASMIVICESAIDALSAAILHPASLCLSTAGARANPRWLTPILRGGQSVYCGFDADAAGDQAAGAMIQIHPAVKRLRPPLKDWNDVLRSRP